MRIVKKLFIIVVVLWIGFVSSAWSQEQNLADILIQAETARQLIPVLSVQHPTMDVDMAYRIQKVYVEKKLTNEKLAGFKAGLTSQGGQQQFGVSAPVAGALFESGKLTDEVIIDSTIFHQLMLETEIGFIIGTSLTQPVANPAALQKSIQAIMPVIELPDLGFTDMNRLKGVDIIAANVAAKQFIVGQPQAVSDVDLNTVTVILSLNEQEINRGKGADASGDQWQAAFWLVNKMIEQGWTLEAGQILMTGALGKMLPGKPGKYVADYGDFGKIVFEVK